MRQLGLFLGQENLVRCQGRIDESCVADVSGCSTENPSREKRLKQDVKHYIFLFQVTADEHPKYKIQALYTT